MVTLKLDRTDYERINALLSVVANAAGLNEEERAAYYAAHAPTPMTPADARRLCADTDRQAQEGC